MISLSFGTALIEASSDSQQIVNFSEQTTRISLLRCMNEFYSFLFSLFRILTCFSIRIKEWVSAYRAAAVKRVGGGLWSEHSSIMSCRQTDGTTVLLNYWLNDKRENGWRRRIQYAEKNIHSTCFWILLSISCSSLLSSTLCRCAEDSRGNWCQDSMQSQCFFLNGTIDDNFT